MTLLAYHLFVQEGVDSVVIECGIGGEYDSTNIISEPSVTAVTALEIDHVDVLGATIEEIAWHKAGIFKHSAPAFSVQQPDKALSVLKKRAEEAKTELVVVPVHPSIEDGKIKLGLAGDFQKSNASLAVVVVARHLQKLGVEGIIDPIAHLGLLSREFHVGLANVKWPGRCDTRKDGKISWCLDGAHTLDSITVAGKWFASLQQNSGSRPKRIMIFNQQTRDAPALARALHSTLSGILDDKSPFSHCIFTTNITFKESGYKPDLVEARADNAAVISLKVQKELATVWNEVDPQTTTEVTGTIEEAVTLARSASNGEETLVLITGSLHLVGGAIEVLETNGTK